MIKEKYLNQVIEILDDVLRDGQRAFVFGSSLESENFLDVDLGVFGEEVEDKQIFRLRELLEESNLPYKFDVVNFEKVDERFRKNVLSKDVLWLI